MMTTAKDKREPPQDAWARWRREHEEVVEKATAPQRVLLEAAVRFVAAICAQPILLRLTAFFLLHAGMGLTPVQVGAAVRRTDRAMRTVQALSAHAMLESLWGELRRHRQPKLHAEHAGPIAKYLVEHPGCTQAEVVAFVASDLKIAIDVQTLRRFLKAYGLGVLRPERGDVNETEEERPFGLGAPISEAPFSCSRLPSR
jgi:transposase